MKQGWEIRRLEEICLRITDGSHFSPKEDLNGKYPMLSVKDMGVTCFSYDNCKYINEDDYKTLVANGCKPSIDDVLVAKDGSYLKTAFVQRVEKEQVILSSIAILTPNKTILNPDFLAFFFKSHHTKDIVERNYLTGTAIKRVILKGFRKISLSVPPIAEQEKIVAELDCLSGIIEKKKQQLKELDNLAQSIFYEMFGDPVENDKGWEVKKLGEVCDIINGFAFKSPLFVKEGDLILRISNIQDGYVDIEDVAHFNKVDYPKVDFERYAVHPNDIVVALSGATTGKLGINKTGKKLYLNQRVAICREKDEVLHRTYLLYYLMRQSASFLETAAGVAQPNLSTEQMKNYTMGIPPKNIQQHFASKIETIEKQKELITQSIKETETLFNSRMDYYFN